jgi:hypothetical protein
MSEHAIDPGFLGCNEIADPFTIDLLGVMIIGLSQRLIPD